MKSYCLYMQSAQEEMGRFYLVVIKHQTVWCIKKLVFQTTINTGSLA